MILDIDHKAPDFILPTSGGGLFKLSGLRGKKVVLYFYPKDMTSGCTKQAEDFRDMMVDFKAVNAVIVGVSKDSVKRHDKFVERYDLNFTLVADEEAFALKAYGVWKEKSMYGRKYMGIERSTFVIDADGVIRALWRKVKVSGHVQDVLKTIAKI